MQHSALLVKAWGRAQLPNGRTLSEMLTLQGLSLWDVVAPTLAMGSVYKVLRLSTQQPSIGQKVRPYVSWAKHKALELFTIRQNLPESPQWPSGPVFLFLGFSPYIYRDVLQPVVAQLAERQEIRSVSLYDRDNLLATPHLAREDGFQSIWQHWKDDKVKAQARGLRRELKLAVTELRSTGTLAKIIRDGDKSLWPQMKDTFTWLFRVFLPRMLPQIAIAMHIIRKYCPRLTISPDAADPRTRIYCLLSRQLGIPSLNIQFGIYGLNSIEWQFMVEDRVAAWGAKSREVFLAHGVPIKKITMTGSPRHDCMVKVPDSEVDRIRTELRIPRKCVMVVFASKYNVPDLFDPNTLASLKKEVFQAADQVAGLCLVVKPHPVEDVQETRRLAKGCRNILFADQATDIRKLTKACDAFVTLGTTATLDALIAGKLVIWPDFPSMNSLDNLFVEKGAFLLPRSTEELVRNMETVVNGSCERVLNDLEPARESFLRKWVYRLDGLASARIEALALRMAGLDSHQLKTGMD